MLPHKADVLTINSVKGNCFNTKLVSSYDGTKTVTIMQRIMKRSIQSIYVVQKVNKQDTMHKDLETALKAYNND